MALVSSGASAMRSVVERRGQRQDLVVARTREIDAGPVASIEHDERIVLRGVELDGELVEGVVEGVAGGALELRQIAEGQRVLQVAGRPRAATGNCRQAGRAGG